MVLLLMSSGPIRRVMEARPFYVVSRLSYGMYLNHFVILRWILPSVAVALRLRLGQTVPAVGLTFVVLVTLSLAISAVLYVTVEKPFLQVRDRVLQIKSNPSGAPVGRGAAAAAGWS